MKRPAKSLRRLRRGPTVGVLLTNGEVIPVPVSRRGLRRDLGRIATRLSARS